MKQTGRGVKSEQGVWASVRTQADAREDKAQMITTLMTTLKALLNGRSTDCDQPILTSSPMTAGRGESFRCWMLNAGESTIRVEAQILGSEGAAVVTVRDIVLQPGAPTHIAGPSGIGRYCRVRVVSGRKEQVRASLQVMSLHDGMVQAASDAR